MIHTVSICHRRFQGKITFQWIKKWLKFSAAGRKKEVVNQKKQSSHTFLHQEQTILNEQIKVDDWGKSIIQILYSEKNGALASDQHCISKWPDPSYQNKEEINIKDCAQSNFSPVKKKQHLTDFNEISPAAWLGADQAMHSLWAQKHRSSTKPTETLWHLHPVRNCNFREWDTTLERCILLSLINPQCRHRGLCAG